MVHFRFRSLLAPFKPVADRLCVTAALPQCVMERFTDDDPTNEPTIIGAREEACAACHNR